MARWDVTTSNAAPARGAADAPQGLRPRWCRRCSASFLTRLGLPPRMPPPPRGAADASHRLRPWLPLVSEARQGWRAGMSPPRMPPPPRGPPMRLTACDHGCRRYPRRARDGALGCDSLERRTRPGGRRCASRPATVVVPALQRVMPDAPRICHFECRTRPGEPPMPRTACGRGGAGAAAPASLTRLGLPPRMPHPPRRAAHASHRLRPRWRRRCSASFLTRLGSFCECERGGSLRHPHVYRTNGQPPLRRGRRSVSPASPC